MTDRTLGYTLAVTNLLGGIYGLRLAAAWDDWLIGVGATMVLVGAVLVGRAASKATA